MSPSYFEFQERRASAAVPLCEVIELDAYLVLEGAAAEASIRRYFDSAVRAAEAAAGRAP